MQHSTIPASDVIDIPSEQTENTTDNIFDVDYMTSKINHTRSKVPFWTENPNVLLNSKYIMELFPIENMSYEQKLNAVTRTVILLTIIGFSITHNFSTLIVGIITMSAIFALFYYHQKENYKTNQRKKMQQSVSENFEGIGIPTSDIVSDLFKLNNESIPDKIFEHPSTSNPFGNVLVTDYDYNPNKKPAPPAFNQNVSSTILNKAKQFVTDANPDHPNIADKLFNDMGNELAFEQSLRPFNSNPSTTIPNDQAGFADFCYGSMTSCKEGNKFACARNLARHVM